MKALSATTEEKVRGFSTASSGNHGISMSVACKKAEIPLDLFLPENTPPYKVAKLRSLGSVITLAGHSWDDADQHARLSAQQTNKQYIHAFEDESILQGHATAALEIVQQMPDIDVFVCSVGGGGIISALSKTIKTYKREARCYGVETYGAHSVSLSLDAQKPYRIEEITSLAHSIAVQAPTDRTYRDIVRYVSGIAVVSDHDAQKVQKDIYHKYSELLELAASCSIAAVENGHIPDIKGKNLVILACGGNLEREDLSLSIDPINIGVPYRAIP